MFSLVQRPIEQNAFEFVVLASLRARQLSRGCTPRVPGADKITITAQMEVAEGKVTREGPLRAACPRTCSRPRLILPPAGWTPPVRIAAACIASTSVAL